MIKPNPSLLIIVIIKELLSAVLHWEDSVEISPNGSEIHLGNKNNNKRSICSVKYGDRLLCSSDLIFSRLSDFSSICTSTLHISELPSQTCHSSVPPDDDLIQQKLGVISENLEKV